MNANGALVTSASLGDHATSVNPSPPHRDPPFKTDEPTVVGGLSAGQVSARRPQWEHGETYPPECVDGGRCARLSVDLRGAGSSYMSASSERVATNTAAATAPAAGIVSTHAQTMRPATPQRTARVPLVAPTPTIAPVIVCVVLTGMPSLEMARMVTPPPVSAEKPPMGCSLVRLCPIVRTMRHPPNAVPSPMAAWQMRITQNGTPNGRFAQMVP